MGINLSKVSLNYFKSKKDIKYAIKDININISNNDEFIALVGHTGSGKSTLVQTLNSLLTISSGDISINYKENNEDIYYHITSNGKKIKYSLSKKEDRIKYKKRVELKPLRRHIGLVFQFPEYQIFEETVLKDIMFGPKNFLKNESEAKEEALKIAKMMDIEPLLEKSPFTLSGGQMRKVAIAGILASNPDILVLDEPTVGLDPIAKRELLEFLKRLNEEEHKTIIIITHDMDVVGTYAKRVLVLNKGELKYDGSKDELFRNEEIIKDNNLSYPNSIRILMELKNKLNIDFDIYKYSNEEVFQEIKEKLGEAYE